MLLFTDQVTKLHLLLNQVLSLSKRPNKLIPLLPFELMHFMLVANVYSFQISFLVLQLNLLVTKLLPQPLLLFVQMQKHFNITI